MGSQRCFREASKCVQLSMGSNWGAHSTFPSFPVSLPSVEGRPAATDYRPLKLGKLNFCLTLLVSMEFRGVSFRAKRKIYWSGLMACASLRDPVPGGLDLGQESDRQQRSKLKQRLVERRQAGETCPELLAAFGREPSNPATVWSNGATDGGSHDPHRIELPVVARHPRNRSQERHRRAPCLKNPVPEAARTGLQDFWIGSSEPMMPIKEKSTSVGRK
jgi:hypothetical protein